MTHDNTWPCALKFMSIGATRIHDPKQLVMTLDHDISNKSETNMKKYELIQDFARQHGVDFYPAGRGVSFLTPELAVRSNILTHNRRYRPSNYVRGRLRLARYRRCRI